MSQVTGYTAKFQDFVTFANKEIEAHGNKGNVSIAQFGDRTISANTQDSVGKIWPRSQDIKDANNMARESFKKAVSDMYGGEKFIPKNVLDAMKLNDYGKGKPLTARRILAVKTAIENDAKLNTFETSQEKQMALHKGWTQAELPKIARAANFLTSACGMGKFEAIDKLSTPGSKENRLLNYGGRFLNSAENFANGLKLIDSFDKWFKGICTSMKSLTNGTTLDPRNYADANTFTKLNLNKMMIDKKYLMGFEKFVFEELSINPKADFSTKDVEKLFGSKNNQAMKFFGRGTATSVISTIDNIPKEKRAAIFSAYDAFTQSANNVAEANKKFENTRSMTWINTGSTPMFIARMVRNLDKVEEMYNSGTLTPENIINKCFPDITDKGNCDYKTLNAHFDKITDQELLSDNPKYKDIANTVQLTMENSGYTLDETAESLKEGKMPPVPKYLCTGTIAFADCDGTVNAGLSLINGDLYRPNSYGFKDGREMKLLSGNKLTGFGFKFPGEKKFYTNATDNKDNIPRVGEKIINMCGKVHVKQANSVMMMLSQSGSTPLRGGIPQINVQCNEHGALDYTLSKNDQTGSITIEYSSPAPLPFEFKWTATIDVDGNVTTTPMDAKMKIIRTDEDRINDAMERKHIKLTDDQKTRAIKILGDAGRAHNLNDKQFDALADFVVTLRLTEGSAKDDGAFTHRIAGHWAGLN